MIHGSRKRLACATKEVIGHTSAIDQNNPTSLPKIAPNDTTFLLSSGTTRWQKYARPEHVLALTDASLDLLDRYTDLHLGFTSVHP